MSASHAVDHAPPARPRVLIIAPHGSYRTSAFIAAAGRLGIEVQIASPGKYSVVSSYAKGLHILLNEPEQAVETMLDAARETPFAGVMGTDDATTELAAIVARRLGLAHNDPRAVRTARRKDLARDALQAAGVNKPRHWHIDLDQPLEAQLAALPYPVVLKPVALSASRGVIRVDGPQEAHLAAKRIAAIVAKVPHLEAEARAKLLAEQFISGTEVAVEGMLYAGQLRLLAIFDKPEPLNGPFFEETYYITPTAMTGAKQRQLQDVVEAACRAYGLSEGPVHAECRVNDEGVFILEVAARTIGGLCSRLLSFGTGYQLEELVLTHLIGEPIAPHAHEGAAGVLMIPIPRAGVLKRVEGILAAQRVPGVDDVDIQIREGHELVPLPEGASYLGFIFARGPDRVSVQKALREAHAHLNFIVAPLFKITVN